MADMPIRVPEGSPGAISIGPDQEHLFRIGGPDQTIFRDLAEVPSGTSTLIDGKDHLLLRHEKDGETVASMQHNLRVRRAGGTTIFSHRAVSLILGEDGVLRGEGHEYKTVTRQGIPGAQRWELPDTVAPLTSDDIARFRRFAGIAKAQLRKRPK